MSIGDAAAGHRADPAAWFNRAADPEPLSHVLGATVRDASCFVNQDLRKSLLRDSARASRVESQFSRCHYSWRKRRNCAVDHI